MSGVLLIVPPFHLACRPAIGVSLLKAALARDGIPCDILYLNLQFAEVAGADLYVEISDEGASYYARLGEWLFAGDLFGADVPDPERYLDEVLLDRFSFNFTPERVERYRDLYARVPGFLDDVMERVPWERYSLVGVSSTFQQNVSSLALLKRLKARHPQIATIMGGGNCEGAMGKAIHELFPFVDYVCSGEGDVIFPTLVKKLLAGESVLGLPGILARGGLTFFGDTTRTPTVRDMDRLPYPDYDDYFQQLAASTVHDKIRPVLAFETSRGCWWGEKHHCTFCGFNGQDLKFRSKSVQRALEELDFLMQRYDVRRVRTVDNILDMRYFEDLLPALAARPLPPNIFYETKANLTKEQLRLMARAGFQEFQPGVESLITSVLKLMDKGITGLQNIRLLKWCAEIDLNVLWSILWGFPAEDPEEYRQLAALLPSLTHLQAPGAYGPIRIDRFSPHFDRAEEYGFCNVRPESAYSYVYPFPTETLARLAYHFEYDYLDGRDPLAYTSLLVTQINNWYEEAGTARLDVLDRGDHLEIVDKRRVATQARWTLDGAARLVYLALDAGNTVRGIQTALAAQLGDAAPVAEQIERWLAEWLDARLLVQEGPRYLALAVNPDGRVHRPIERFAALLAGTPSA